MSERHTFILAHKVARAGAVLAVQEAPDGYVVEIRPLTRSLEQNAKMWAMLTDVSRQVNWHGNRLQPEEWKDVFTACLKRQKVVPGLDGGFVVIGARTSRMTVAEMSDLVEIVYAFGSDHGVQWTEPAVEQAYQEWAERRRAA